MFGRLYHLGDRAAMHRANELLDRFGFAEVAGSRRRRTRAVCAADSTWSPA